MFLVICAAGGGALVVVQALLSALAIGVHHGPHVRHGGSRGWGHHGARGGAGAKGGGRLRTSLHRAGGHGAKAGTAVKGAPAHLSPQAKAIAAVAAAHAHRTHQYAANAFPAGGDSAAWIWLHSLLNFQGLVAGATVLGLAGLAATAGGFSTAAVLGIALGAGLAMMMIVAAIFTAMINMDEDGTVQMEQAVGALGKVYLSIPADQGGLGKVLVKVHGRTMELAAVSYEERPLARGEPVMVVGVQDNGVVEVVSGEKYLPDLAPATAA
jgi:hypothetical protein